MEKVSLGKIGRYEIIKILGRGGMGEVILAQDENLGRRVAIKRPFKSAIAEGLARFQVEAKAATLRHPNIPAVYEMGVDDGLPFIAMEFVEGENLEKLIETRRDEIDLITKLRIIEQVCSALGYAHENGVVHRDIKPANIIVQPDGVAKIIDFGIAKVQDDTGSSDANLTKPSQLIGSLHYIAPERFWGVPTDGRVDIFSVGVTLFKLLTGKEPFTGGEATASFKIMNEAHTSLAAFLHDYPPVLDEIVAKSLAKNPDDRYQTGEDFADALHEVIEDLKRTRVSELFGDAERLTTERRFVPALELLDEAIKLDPSNTQARKLRKFVREHQERIRRAERLRECLLRADEALLSANFDEALTQLKDALNLDQESAEIKAKIQSVEESKRRFESSSRALAEAERVKLRGDINGALRIVTKALQEDPENKKLGAMNATLVRQMEIEAQRGRLLELLENATRALATRDYEAADKLLNEANEIDPSNLDTDKLRRELAKARELEQRRAVLDEIQLRVQDFVKSDQYDQAADLLNRALDRLPNEALLHRLKAEVDAEARRFEVRRVVDGAISQANELFASSPFEALAILQKALEQVPGEERLVAYERSLRHQMEAQRSEQLRGKTILKARELLDAQQFDKAVVVLESFQVEFGQQDDVDQLLSFAREKLAAQQRVEIVGRSMSEARAFLRDGRLEDAIRLLESAAQQTKDGAVSGLLNEVREQQAAIARRSEALLKRVEQLRERGELDEAIQLLQEQLAAAPGNATLQQLADSLQAQRKQKQVTGIAIRAANEAMKQNNFAAAMESLQGVLNAYGESAELTHAIQDVESRRSAYAGEAVAKSIESARNALLKNDASGALEALKSATPFLEFADAQKQADWQKIGQSVKKALQQAGGTGTHAVFDKQLLVIAGTKPRKMAIWAVGAAVAVALAIGIVVMFTRPKTLIVIPNVPSNATVLVGGVKQNVGSSGSVTAAVKPGHVEISISAPGFEKFSDAVDVDSGQTVREDVKLTKEIGAKDPQGTLAVIPQSDLPRIRVFIDGEASGEKAAGEQIKLKVGTYRVKYTWPGYKDSPEHQITIADGQHFQDTVALEKIRIGTTGNLVVSLASDLTSVQYYLDGALKGEIRSGQKIQLQAGKHQVKYASPGYKDSPERTIDIAVDKNLPDYVTLEKLPPPPNGGTLSVSLPNDLPSVRFYINGELKGEIGPGQRIPLQAGSYRVKYDSNGYKMSAERTIEITKDHNFQDNVVLEKPILETFHPTGGFLDLSSVSIEQGKSATLSWHVDHASSVQIAELGAVDSSGTKQVSPVQTTTYHLIADGIALSQKTVEVTGLPPIPILQAALAPYKAVFQSATGKNCKAAFSNSFGGKLKNDFSPWCEYSKGFAVSEQCTQVDGTPDAPTLTCHESVVYDPAAKPLQSSRVFRFKKGPDGNYQFVGW